MSLLIKDSFQQQIRFNSNDFWNKFHFVVVMRVHCIQNSRYNILISYLVISYTELP